MLSLPIIFMFSLFLQSIDCRALNNKIIDLSYLFDEYTPNYPHPAIKPLTVTTVLQGKTSWADWVETYDICTSEHVGTHIDAPVHFVKGAKSVDKIPTKNMYRLAGVKVDVRHKTCMNPDYKITAQDLEEWHDKHGPLPDGVVVLFETGWGEKAFNYDAYSGIDKEGKVHFPGLGEEGAQWLIDYKKKYNQVRGVIAIGTDTYSMESGTGFQDRFKVHVMLLGNEIYGIENMHNVNKLPATGFTISAFPLKVKGGSGGPTRVVAEIGGTPFNPFDESTLTEPEEPLPEIASESATGGVEEIVPENIVEEDAESFQQNVSGVLPDNPPENAFENV